MLRETYSPVLQEREQTKSEGKTLIVSYASRPHENWTRVFKGPWVRPVKMLLRSPIVTLFALYTSMTNGYLLLILATFGTVFQDEYRFKAGPSGLTYLGLTFGFFVGHANLGIFSDWSMARMEARHGKSEPENRLPPLILGSLLITSGLLWYGWSVDYHTHWIVPILGSAVVAFGVMYTYLPVQIYLIDVFPVFSASATGACTIVRSISAAILPLAANPLYDRIGYGWDNTLLAFMAAVIVPFAILLLKYWKRIRASSRIYNARTFFFAMMKFIPLEIRTSCVRFSVMVESHGVEEHISYKILLFQTGSCFTII